MKMMGDSQILQMWLLVEGHVTEVGLQKTGHTERLQGKSAKLDENHTCYESNLFLVIAAQMTSCDFIAVLVLNTHHAHLALLNHQNIQFHYCSLRHLGLYYDMLSTAIIYYIHKVYKYSGLIAGKQEIVISQHGNIKLVYLYTALC